DRGSPRRPCVLRKRRADEPLQHRSRTRQVHAWHAARDRTDARPRCLPPPPVRAPSPSRRRARHRGRRSSPVRDQPDRLLREDGKRRLASNSLSWHLAILTTLRVQCTNANYKGNPSLTASHPTQTAKSTEVACRAILKAQRMSRND